MTDAVGDPLTEQVIGAAIEVHWHLGPGLLEKIYEEALCVEFALRSIPFDRQVAFHVVYKGRVIKGQRLDLLASARSLSRSSQCGRARTTSSHSFSLS